MAEIVYGKTFESKDEFMQGFAETGTLLGTAKEMGVRRRKATFVNTLEQCLDEGLICRSDFNTYELTEKGKRYVEGVGE